MLSPPAVRGVGSPVGAGSYAGAPQSPPAFLGLAPETTPSIQLHVSSDIRSFSPPVAQRQAPEHAPPSFTGNFSGIDAPSAQNTQFNFQTQYALENPPTANACPSYPVWPATSSSPATLNAQNPAAEPAYIIPEQSSHTHRGSLASLVSEDSFPLPSSSGLQDEFVSSSPFFHALASPGASSQIVGHVLPQEGASSAAPKAPVKPRRDGKRKRADNPKDPIATKRHQDQREADEENMEKIVKMVVPPSVGRVAKKKDRLGLGTSQSLCLRQKNEMNVVSCPLFRIVVREPRRFYARFNERSARAHFLAHFTLAARRAH